MTTAFWNTIQQSSGDPDKLKVLLEAQSDEEVVAFGKAFYHGLIQLNRWEIWGAGYVMAGGMGDDGFHYFRSWIIGKGKEAFETALSTPDELGKFASANDDFENELLEYVAVDVLEARGIDDPRDDSMGFADDQPTGSEWSEDDVYDRYPKLAAQFG